VYVDDLRMIGKVAANLGTTVDESQIAALDEWLERLLVERPQVLVDRVQLDDAQLAFVKQLVQSIRRWDRRDVSRPRMSDTPPCGSRLL
jgi:hypothetical protein